MLRTWPRWIPIAVVVLMPVGAHAEKLYLVCNNTTIEGFEDENGKIWPEIPYINPMHVTVDFDARTVAGAVGGNPAKFQRDATESEISFAVDNRNNPSYLITHEDGVINRIDGQLQVTWWYRDGRVAFIKGRCYRGTPQF